ncbi:MAG: hypothetical protein ACHQK8_07155, partial [Bacteroidia bacterium]
MSSSIQVAFKKKANNTKYISVKVSAKNKEGRRGPAESAHVNLYAQNKDGQINAGKCVTDEEGKGEIKLPANLPMDTGMSHYLIAKIENDELYANSDEEIRFKEAGISIKLNPSDTNKTVTAKVTMIGSDGKEKPVKDVPIKFYIQRLFGIMPAAEDNSLNTDADGIAVFNYPKEIPGGMTGDITVVARIEDNELFGTVEANSNVKWGTTIAPEKNPFPRALWEPYAPPSLIIVICVLFGGVWCTYMFIFYN